jgi:hypothetical protein
LEVKAFSLYELLPQTSNLQPPTSKRNSLFPRNLESLLPVDSGVQELVRDRYNEFYFEKWRKTLFNEFI